MIKEYKTNIRFYSFETKMSSDESTHIKDLLTKSGFDNDELNMSLDINTDGNPIFNFSLKDKGLKYHTFLQIRKIDNTIKSKYSSDKIPDFSGYSLEIFVSNISREYSTDVISESFLIPFNRDDLFEEFSDLLSDYIIKYGPKRLLEFQKWICDNFSTKILKIDKDILHEEIKVDYEYIFDSNDLGLI